MAKKCVLCGKNASFFEGGGEFRGKTLCKECYDKAASAKSEEALGAMGFDCNLLSNEESYKGHWVVTALIALAVITAIVCLFFTIQIWSGEENFGAGLMNLLTGAIIFTVLYAFSIITENVIAIRVHLESRDKGRQ